MGQIEKIQKLLELYEQPGQLSDEQLAELMEDEEMRRLAEQLAVTKRAFVKRGLKEDEKQAEEEWEKFARQHFPDIKPQRRWLRIAASLAGVLAVSGLTLAAIHFWNFTPSTSPKDDGSAYTQAKDTTTRKSALPTLQKGAEGEAVIFSNVPLDSMLMEIAANYQVDVEFRSEEARQLRFHFVWKRGDNLDRIVEKLNNFEALNIVREDGKLIVK